MENPFQNVVEQFKAQREKSLGELQKSLEGATIEQKIFSHEEMEELIKLRQLLSAAMDKLLKDGGYSIEKARDTFAKVQKAIDPLSLWKTKFSTGTIGESDQGDSIYYTTPSGISLRFKMANVEKDVHKVIQPFMENISFEKDHAHLSKPLPEIGLDVTEYCSKEFFDAQCQPQASGDFESQVKIYSRADGLNYVVPPEHLFHRHPGNQVNHIFFIKDHK